MKSSNRPKDLIQIGRISGAHGIKGALKVYSSADAIELFDLHDDLILIDTTGRKLPCTVLWVQPYKNGVRLAFKEVISREQAESLVDSNIYIPRASLPEMEPNTNFWDDLMGMAVYADDGEHLGEVTQIIATGANDVYVVKTVTDYPVEEILLPAIASVILEVDVVAKRMQVRIPEGLI